MNPLGFLVSISAKKTVRVDERQVSANTSRKAKKETSRIGIDHTSNGTSTTIQRYDACWELEVLSAWKWLANMASSEIVQQNLYALGSTVITVHETVMDVMRIVPKNAAIQTAALRVLARLRVCGLNRFSERSADELALLALKTHPFHVGVQLFGLGLLTRMISEPFEYDMHMNDDIYAVAIFSLLIFGKYPEVQKHAFMVLIRQASFGEYAQVMNWSNAVEPTMTCLRMHPKNKELQSAGVLLLRCLSQHTAVVDTMVQCGAIEQVVNALRTFPDDQTLQENGLVALVKLSMNGLHVNRMVSTRVVKVAMTAMSSHLQNSAVQEHGMCLLSNLLDRLMIKHGLSKMKKCSAVVVAATKAHPMHANIQEKGSQISSKLASQMVSKSKQSRIGSVEDHHHVKNSWCSVRCVWRTRSRK